MKTNMKRRWMVTAGAALGGYFLVAASLSKGQSDSFESRWSYGRIAHFTPTAVSVSGDGLWVAYDSDRGGSPDICLMRLPSKESLRLFTGSGIERRPVLSFDGGTIAFSRVTDGYEHVWLMDSRGSNQVQATKGKVQDWPSAFSRNGQVLYFVREGWKGRLSVPLYQVFALSLAQSNRFVIRSIGEGTSTSSDGSLIVRQSVPDDGIWVRNVAKGADLRVGQGYCPTISPDGRFVAWLPEQLQDETIAILDTTTSKRLSVPAIRPMGNPIFSWDSKYIIFRPWGDKSDIPRGLFRVSLDSREMTRMADLQ